ncbi:unnamed protein product, partial [marine sediment metagenome]
QREFSDPSAATGPLTFVVPHGSYRIGMQADPFDTTRQTGGQTAFEVRNALKKFDVLPPYAGIRSHDGRWPAREEATGTELPASFSAAAPRPKADVHSCAWCEKVPGGSRWAPTLVPGGHGCQVCICYGCMEDGPNNPKRHSGINIVCVEGCPHAVSPSSPLAATGGA